MKSVAAVAAGLIRKVRVYATIRLDLVEVIDQRAIAERRSRANMLEVVVEEAVGRWKQEQADRASVSSAA